MILDRDAFLARWRKQHFLFEDQIRYCASMAPTLSALLNLDHFAKNKTLRGVSDTDISRFAVEMTPTEAQELRKTIPWWCEKLFEVSKDGREPDRSWVELVIGVSHYWPGLLGYGVAIRSKRIEDIDPEIAKLGLGRTADQDTLRQSVQMWWFLCTIANLEKGSGNRVELAGLVSDLTALVQANPMLWIEAMPWIFARHRECPEAIRAITFELALKFEAVTNAIKTTCSHENLDVQLYARGIHSLLFKEEGNATRTAVNALATLVDGEPSFPHPLALRSGTWLADPAVEDKLTDGVRRALRFFATEYLTQSANIEEALTASLLKELEVEFRNANVVLGLFGQVARRTILNVSQRPISKSTEEPIYGCDIAWVAHAELKNAFSATWVELVQVKKSQLSSGKARVQSGDSWLIDVARLGKIQLWSATAVYWLIRGSGDVMVVPARYLGGIVQATAKQNPTATKTVSYAQLRSVAIPLEQHLVQLFVGMWVGTNAKKTVDFAKGENPKLKPRTIFEVAIRSGSENENDNSTRTQR